MTNIQKARREGRVQWILNRLGTIKENEKELDFDKMLAEIMIKHGVSRRIASEDLRTCMTYLRM